MNFWGKLIGFFLGLFVARFWGAFFGLIIGNYFDQALAKHINPLQRAKIQSAFFKATFQVMGHIAKADGHVSERELNAARKIMDKYAPHEQQRKLAIEYFNQGKQSDFSLDRCLRDFMAQCLRERALLRIFLEIQLQAAYAEGHLSHEKKKLIQEICMTLRLGMPNFMMWDLLYAQFYSGFSGSQHQQHYQGQSYQSTQGSLQEAYAVLEVSKNSTDAEVKKAYRKLMSQHHPDKLAANGLPPDMLKAATEKTQQIQKAYDDVKKTRGMA